MKLRKMVPIVMAALPLLFSLGCDREGPMERSGERIDRSAEKAGENIERGAERAGDRLEDAADRARKD